MAQRFIAKGPTSENGAMIQLMAVIQDQGGGFRSEPFLDPMPLAEAERRIEQMRADGQFSSDVWEGPLP